MAQQPLHQFQGPAPQGQLPTAPVATLEPQQQQQQEEENALPQSELADDEQSKLLEAASLRVPGLGEET